MAQLDPSIALGIRPPQFDNPQDIRAKALTIGAMQRQADADTRALGEQQTIRDLYRKNTSASGVIDSAGLASSTAAAGLGDKIPAMQKANLETQKLGTETEAGKLKLVKDKIDFVNGGLASLLTQQNVTQDQINAKLNEFIERGVMTTEDGAKAARSVGANPRQWLLQRAVEGLEHAKQIDLLLPKADEQDRGGVINEGTINPLTGVRTAGADIQKTATPGEKAVADRATRAATGGGFNQELLAALAARGVSLPSGFRSKEQMAATLNGLISRYPDSTMDQIAEAVASGQIGFGGEKKETQTAAALGGKISYAENEIKMIAPLIRAASANVPRGSFVPWSKLVQYTDAQLSDPALKELKSYMTTMSNAYDMLAARGGTDMDKRRHNRELFDTADSPKALEAALKAVENEASISGKAAQRSMLPRSQRDGATDAGLPPDVAAALKKHGAKP